MAGYTETTVVENGEEYVVREYADGDKCWYQNGKLHRLNGPVVEYANGSKYWYQNNNLHRLNGPAIEYANGSKEWWQNGKCHRLNGPAIEWADGDKSWWIEGKYFNSEEAWKKAVMEYQGNNIESSQSNVASNICTCDIRTIAVFGCQCGAFQREMQAKYKQKGDSNG